MELADCSSLDGVELFLELAVGLDAVATLKNVENIGNQNFLGKTQGKNIQTLFKIFPLIFQIFETFF